MRNAAASTSQHVLLTKKMTKSIIFVLNFVIGTTSLEQCSVEDGEYYALQGYCSLTVFELKVNMKLKHYLLRIHVIYNEYHAHCYIKTT